LEIFLTEIHDCLTDQALFGGSGFKNVRLECDKNVSSAGNKSNHLTVFIRLTALGAY